VLDWANTLTDLELARIRGIGRLSIKWIRSHAPRQPAVDPARGERRTMTVEDVARALGISRNTAYAAARRGDFPTVRIGSRVLVPREAFERWLEGR
jgi:excisionase family DNA binding protein